MDDETHARSNRANRALKGSRPGFGLMMRFFCQPPKVICGSLSFEPMGHDDQNRLFDMIKRALGGRRKRDMDGIFKTKRNLEMIVHLHLPAFIQHGFHELFSRETNGGKV
jgi:hypothetical protein